MTDNPRFRTVTGDVDAIHQRYHGAPVAELVLGLTDRWRLWRSGGRAQSKHALQWRLRATAVGSVALTILAGTAIAQETVRIRGTIERVDGNTYVVRSRDGYVHALALATDASVAASVKSSIVDIRPGLYIGIAAIPQSDGSLRALEAHIFDGSMRGTGEGHRAWDLLPKSTMTNAVVEEIVSTVDGHAITLRYKDGQQRIAIPAGTTVVTYLPGTVGELSPGAAVFVPSAVKQSDGKLRAQRVMVGRDIAPPQ
jgi:Domain of unknown function (DUF5666)